MRASTASLATWQDRYGESVDFCYDLDKCLNIAEKVFIATFPAKYTWDPQYNLVSRSKNTIGKILDRRDASGMKVVSVCIRSAIYRKAGEKVKRPGGIIRSVRIHRMVFTMIYGPIPPNCYVGFINGNRDNCHPDNLELRLLRNHQPVPPDIYEGSAVTPKDIDLGPILGYKTLDGLQDFLSKQF